MNHGKRTFHNFPTWFDQLVSKSLEFSWFEHISPQSASNLRGSLRILDLPKAKKYQTLFGYLQKSD